MNQEILKKLKYTLGPALIMNAPEGMVPEGFATQMEIHSPQKYPFILLFVKNEAQFREHFNSIYEHLSNDALYWVCYPKKTSGIATDVNRDILWRLAHEISEFTAVANVAIDDRWSALRFRHQSKVKRA
jgi:hypothetical protein